MTFQQGADARPPEPGDDRSMHERMLAGEWYVADDPGIIEAHRRAVDLTTAYNATTARDGERRRELLVDLLGAVGEGTEIRLNLPLGD